MMTHAMTGYALQEYLIVIDIPEALRHKIEKAREELMTNYPVRQPKTGRPHVGLVRFSAGRQEEQRIIDRLLLITLSQQPFLVEFSDFGGYPMHCIYIQIRTRERIKALVKAYKELRPLLRARGEAPHFLDDPVIPLAARMDKDIYLSAMKEYAGKHFNGRFLASSVLLLARGNKQERYRIIRRFEMDSLPIGIQQGALF